MLRPVLFQLLLGCQEEVGLKDSELSYLIFDLKCHFFYSLWQEKSWVTGYAKIPVSLFS